jgi:indolepyruvate decarboxylase
VGSAVYRNVEMADILAQLSGRITKRAGRQPIAPEKLGPILGGGEDPITADVLYPRLAEFFQPDDVIMTDTGTSSLGLAFARLSKGAEFHNHTLWASIGWATPAAFGAVIGAPDRRLILITGEGSHQMTAQEISQFGRHGLHLIVLAQQFWLSQRPAAVQGHGLGLQRHCGVELRRASSRLGLPGVVQCPCEQLRRAR